MASSTESSPPPRGVSSPPVSTAPSSPPATSSPVYEPDEEECASKPISISEENPDKRFARLEYVLKKSAIYASMLKAQMDKQKAARGNASSSADSGPANKNKSTSARTRSPRKSTRGKKRTRVDSDESEADDPGPSKRAKVVEVAGEDDTTIIFEQPKLITGAKLKPYQLEGLQWMVSLDQNGISGILADEMGLGKTLQAIAFSAYVREQRASRPFLVVCPLSVLHNWVEEYAKFAPTIPVCMYHGTPAERAELRRTVMAPPSDDSSRKSDKNGAARGSKQKGARPKPKSMPKKRAKAKPRKGVRRSGRLSKIESDDEHEPSSEEKEVIDADDEEELTVDSPSERDVPASPDVDDSPSFPVVITTYEMIIKDSVHLAQYQWGYIVVDEGHRLKNLDCKLMREIKKYPSAGRMILTGTPLHNNLAELWSLLNFILPDIFNDVDGFQEWFNLPDMQTGLGSEKSGHIIHSLHSILKPFLLRRLKADVEANLPPKKEYVLYAPLTQRQHELYSSVLDGGLRAHLLAQGRDKDRTAQAAVEVLDDEDEDETKHRRTRRHAGRKSYAVDGDDDEYFDMLEAGQVDARGVRQLPKARSTAQLGREHHYQASLKKVNNMKLQNTVMQLRKVCSHPFLFDWPTDPETRQPVLDAGLIDASGKMMVLDRLLTELFRRKHKVLLFSQFTTMLDIIEDWASEFKGWRLCRIDGSTAPLERRSQMNAFQNGGDAPDAPCLFLLSTRAGGLGINLVAADTVIFYDQDWNPQMDAQAQDRAHRIGQTKPVLIFRLVSAHTIETKIMQRASEKRKLEALVIAKGKFKMPAAAAQRGKPETMAEVAAALLRLEGEKIEIVPDTAAGRAGVLSDADLEMLLDRRPEVFADRGKGWTSASERQAVADGRKAAFAVYEAPVDEGNEALAKMLGEDVE